MGVNLCLHSHSSVCTVRGFMCTCTYKCGSVCVWGKWVCWRDTWEQPSGTLESRERREEWGLKLPSAQRQWPWVVNAVRVKAFRSWKESFKKNTLTHFCFTPHRDKDQPRLDKAMGVWKRDWKYKEIYINCQKTPGEQWLTRRGGWAK